MLINKAQGSLEYLLLVGGIVLVVTIIIASLVNVAETIKNNKLNNAICGNAKCEEGETLQNCRLDCKTTCNNNGICDPDEVFLKCANDCGQCKTNFDCQNQQACSIGTCNNPQTPNAACSFTPITTCNNNDNCCPTECNKTNDNDCGTNPTHTVCQGTSCVSIAGAGTDSCSTDLDCQPIACFKNIDCADNDYSTLDYCSSGQCINYTPDRRFTTLPIGSAHSSFVKKAVFIDSAENNYTLNYIADNFDLYGSDTLSWSSLNNFTGEKCNASATIENNDCVSGKCLKLENIDCAQQIIKQKISKIEPGNYNLSFDFKSTNRQGSVALRDERWKDSSGNIVGKTIKNISRTGNGNWQNASQSFTVPTTDDFGETTSNHNFSILIYDYADGPQPAMFFDNINLSNVSQNLVQNPGFENDNFAWHSGEESGCKKIQEIFNGKFKNAIYYSPYHSLSIYSPKMQDVIASDLLVKANGNSVRRLANDSYRITKISETETQNIFSSEFLDADKQCGLNIYFRDNVVFPPLIENYASIKTQLPTYYQNQTDWTNVVSQSLSKTTNDLHAQGYKQIINTLQFDHKETEQLMSAVDGAMMEHFLPDTRFDPTDTSFFDNWQWTVSKLKEFGKQGKILWVQAFDNKNWQTNNSLDVSEIIKDQRFNFATFLLAKYDNSYYSYKVHQNNASFYNASLNYFPEWDIDLGDAIGDYSIDTSGLYYRDFANGKVIVNPTRTAKSITLNQNYFDIEGNAKTGTITVQPIEGVILFSEASSFTVILMKSLSFAAGTVVRTDGYYIVGDGGSAEYLIKTASEYGSTPDGFRDHELANGNIAVLQNSGSVNVKQCGAKGDNVSDDTLAIQSCLNYASSNGLDILGATGNYKVNYLLVKNGIRKLDFTNGIIKGSGNSGEYGILRLDGPNKFNGIAVSNAVISARIDMSNGDKFGIYGDATYNSTFEKNNIFGFTDGPKADKKYGLFLFGNSHDNIIQDNEITGFENPTQRHLLIDLTGDAVPNGGYFNNGITVRSNNPNKNNTVRRNTLINGSYCVLLQGSENNLVTENNCIGQNHRGIYVGASAWYNTITKNNISDYLSSGLILGYGASYNTISDNILESQYFGGEASININTGAKNNIVKNNTIDAGPNYGVYLGPDSIGNIIQENTISGFNLAGIGLENDWGSINSPPGTFRPYYAFYSKPNYADPDPPNSGLPWSYNYPKNNIIKDNTIGNARSTRNGAAISLSQIDSRGNTGIRNTLIENNRVNGALSYNIFVYTDTPGKISCIDIKNNFFNPNSDFAVYSVNGKIADELTYESCPPDPCNNNGTCDTSAGETQDGCPGDCFVKNKVVPDKIILADYYADGLKYPDNYFDQALRGRVKIPELLDALTELHANTFFFLIHNSSESNIAWEDFQTFVVAAQAKNIDVFAYLVPPAEKCENDLPYKCDFESWGNALATMSLQAPNLKGWIIDDFSVAFDKKEIKKFVSASTKVNPNFMFFAVSYYRYWVWLQPLLDWADSVDGIVFPFYSGYPKAGTTTGCNHSSTAELFLEIDLFNHINSGGELSFLQTTVAQNKTINPGENTVFSKQFSLQANPTFEFSIFQALNGLGAPNPGYYDAQVLVDNEIAWQQDLGNINPGPPNTEFWKTINLADYTSNPNPEIKLKIVNKATADNEPVSFAFITKSLGWAATKTGSQISATEKEINKPLNLSMIIMTYTIPMSPCVQQVDVQYVQDMVSKSLDATKNRNVNGAVTFVLDKVDQSPDSKFDTVKNLYETHPK